MPFILVDIEDDSLLFIYAIAAGIFGLFAFPRLLRWFRSRTQARAPSAEEVMAKDHRPPVIYLRSFRDDGTKPEKSTFVFAPIPTILEQPTYEEQIAGHFRKIGPLVALSGSGHGLPELGAARMMTQDEDWKQKFYDLIKRCSLIIFRAGDSESLLWELQQLVRHVDSRKVIVYLQIGEETNLQVQQARYNKFRRLTASLFPKPLPEQRKKNLYLTFGEYWQPILEKNLKKLLRAKGFR